MFFGRDQGVTAKACLPFVIVRRRSKRVLAHMLSFGPTDNKFATASDDGTVRVWDFQRCVEEHILRGHGADVKQVDWHPQKGLIASASKDLQTPVKLWDPRAGQSLATIHAHKGTVMDIKWNRNGTWFLTASRDHLIKLYDVRYLKQEQQIFRGHKKEAFSVAWHPVHEDLFASGGSEGSILFWQIGEDKEVGGLEGAHDSLIWSLAWHPLGHILVSGSNDHSTKFWARNRPGEADREQRGNAFPTITPGELLAMKKTAGGNKDDSAATSDEPTMIPGMGDTDAAEADVAKREQERLQIGIPGLDWSHEDKNEFDRKILVQQQENNKKKIPYARPVPRSFVAAWESNRSGGRRNRSRSPSPHDGRRRRDDSRNNDRRNDSSNIKQEFIPPQDGGNSRPPDPHAGPAPNNSQPPHPGQRTAAPHEAHHPGREMAVPQSQMGPPNPADLNSADAGSMGNPQHQENINNHTRFEHGPSRGDGNGPHNNFPPPHFHQPHPDGQQQPPMEGPHQQQQHGFPMNEMMQEGHNMPDQRMHPPEQMMHPPEQMMHPPDQTIHPPGHPMPPVEQRMHHPEQMMGPPPPEQGGLPPEQMMHPPDKMMHHPPLHGDGGPPGGFMPGPGPPPGGMEWEESEMYDMYGNPYDPSLGEDYADPNYLDEWGEPIYGEGLGMDGRFHHDGGDPNIAESGEWRRPPQKRGRGRGRGMPRGRGRGGAGMNHHGGEDRPPPLMDEDFSMRPRPRRGRAGARLRGADRMMGGRGRSRGRVRPLRGGARKRGGIRGMPPPLMEQ